MLIRARALIRLESWSDAGVAAAHALAAARTPEQRREAWLYLGLVDAGLRHPADAITSLDSAVLSTEAERRSAALLARGRARLALGRPDLALDDFRSSNAEDAAFERAHAALAGGDALLAAVFADSLAMRLPFREAQWLMLLDSLARSGLAPRASALTETIRLRPDVRAGPRARLMLADGDRLLAAGEDSLATQRYRDVLRIAADSVEARAAALRLIKLEIRAVRADSEFPALRRRLQPIMGAGGVPGQEAADAVSLIDLADSLAARATTPDAWWFLRAEVLRDSLGARALAADAFAAMPDRFPDSPWTPKGMLAAIALGHPSADALRALLAGRYADNPYTRAATGEGDQPERFAGAGGLAPDHARERARHHGRRPGEPARPADDEPVRGRAPRPRDAAATARQPADDRP